MPTLSETYRRQPPLRHGQRVRLPDGREAQVCRAYYVKGAARWRVIVRTNGRRGYFWINQLVIINHHQQGAES